MYFFIHTNRSFFSRLTKALSISLLCWNVLGVSSGLSQHSTRKIRGNDKSLAKCQSSYRGLTNEALSRYIDASGRPGSGIYGGNSLWYGSFSECKKMSDARYCLTMFNAFVDLGNNQSKAILPLQWGVCTPDTCSKENIADGIEYLLKNVSGLPVRLFSSKISNMKVQCAESPDYTTGVILTIVFFGLLIGLCVFATILELIMDAYKSSDKLEKEKSGEFSMEASNEKTPLLGQEFPKKETQNSSKSVLFEAIKCFSVVRNSCFILNTNVGKSDLTYLHGIRVISLFWIILFHFGMGIYIHYMGIFLEDNPKDVNRLQRRTSFSAVVNGYMAVDTFFVLSGLLAIYTNLKKMDKNGGKVNWFKYYFHRFWRLTPSYILAILFLTKLRPFFGDGPLWYTQVDTSKCSDYWWTNLLYINNLYPQAMEEKCMSQSWYLASDMQFFVISPLFILIVLRYGFKPFLGFASFVVLASMITTASLIADKNALPVIGTRRDSERDFFGDFFKDIYTKPYCRIPPYIIGMVMGYVVYKYTRKITRLNWFWAVFIWCVAIGTALTMVYAPHNAIKFDPHAWSKGERVIFGSLRWVLWSMCIAWVIYSCQYGYAGLIKSILAAKFWIPLSRINYAAFILHVEVTHVLESNVEAPLHITVFTLVNYFLAILVLSYSCAFIWTVVVELPFANLESLLTRQREK